MTISQVVRTAGVSLLVAAMAAPSAQAATVFPIPGSASASPFSQISFRGIAPADIGTVTVRGSRSGSHSGVLRAHSDGQGASWVPRRRFVGGERVTVRTALPIDGGRGGDFRFGVAVWPGRVELQQGRDTVAPGPRHRFRTRRDLAPPRLTVASGARPAEPGHVFITPKTKNDTLQSGPMIADVAGRPIWFLPRPGIRAATDLRVQIYQGRPVLTWWEGTSRQGIGSGNLVIAGQDYRTIARVRVPNGYRADLHEFLITPRNSALIIALPVVKADLSSEGGSRNGQLVDSVVQEIDLDTGLVLFEWHSRGRVAMADSYLAPSRSPREPWDPFHANSISVDHDGDLLVSARNTWAVYKLDRNTGATEWVLGGRRSTFRLGDGVPFAWQHDAQRRADGTITLFDNSAAPAVASRSRAIAVALETGTRQATLVHARAHPRNLLAATQGNYQTFASGGGLVGWGSQRYLTEYDAAGSVLWDARLSVGYESYRAYRFPWVGRPSAPPKAVAVRRGDSMDVYASWNGATEVAEWQILGGAAQTTLAPVAQAARTGFETHVSVPARTAYVAVRAFDHAGALLGTSLVTAVRGR